MEQQTTDAISEALCFDPFEGDFGGSGDRPLRDKIVKFRKPHTCHICATETKVGEIGRNKVDVIDGELLSFFFCYSCCLGMQASVEDGDDYIIEQRYELGDCQRFDRAIERK
jgi:hypothetical protein